MAKIFVATVMSLFAVAYCGQYTVTEEAYFDVEVKDLDGPGEDFRGRFVVALFGETAPMTSMNFASIAKGWKKGKGVSNIYIYLLVVVSKTAKFIRSNLISLLNTSVELMLNRYVPV